MNGVTESNTICIGGAPNFVNHAGNISLLMTRLVPWMEAINVLELPSQISTASAAVAVSNAMLPAH